MEEQDCNSPRYMQLGHMTRQQVADWIDDLANVADQEWTQQDYSAQEMLLSQLSEYAFDRFCVPVSLQPKSEESHPFELQVSNIIDACAHSYLRLCKDQNVHYFRLLMKQVLDYSFSDVQDMLQAQIKTAMGLSPASSHIVTLKEQQKEIIQDLAHYAFKTR